MKGKRYMVKELEDDSFALIIGLICTILFDGCFIHWLMTG